MGDERHRPAKRSLCHSGSSPWGWLLRLEFLLLALLHDSAVLASELSLLAEACSSLALPLTRLLSSALCPGPTHVRACAFGCARVHVIVLTLFFAFTCSLARARILVRARIFAFLRDLARARILRCARIVTFFRNLARARILACVRIFAFFGLFARARIRACARISAFCCTLARARLFACVHVFAFGCGFARARILHFCVRANLIARVPARARMHVRALRFCVLGVIRCRSSGRPCGVFTLWTPARLWPALRHDELVWK